MQVIALGAGVCAAVILRKVDFEIPQSLTGIIRSSIFKNVENLRTQTTVTCAIFLVVTVATVVLQVVYISIIRTFLGFGFTENCATIRVSIILVSLPWSIFTCWVFRLMIIMGLIIIQICIHVHVPCDVASMRHCHFNNAD